MKDGRDLLQNPKSPIIHLEASSIGSKQHPYLPSTPEAPLELLDHMVQVAKQLAHQLGPLPERVFLLCSQN